MKLYEQWANLVQAVNRQGNTEAFWNEYYYMEKLNYIEILKEQKVYSDKLSVLAEHFNMDESIFIGFLDGINTSLKAELNIEELESDSEITIDVDYEKLYYNMLDARAKWLYTLPEWDGILSEEKRNEILKDFRSKIIAVSEKVDRNAPCPCGSGKKYKKCCGA
jgi:hypothetical protein